MAIRADLSLTSLSLRLRAPLQTAHGSIAAREGMRICLVAEDGTRGEGEAMPLAAFGTGSLARTRAALEELEGMSLEVPAYPGELATLLGPLTDLPAARHALEQAALDLQARRAGRTLCDWLWTHAQETSLVGDLANVLGRAAPARSIPVNALLSAQAPDALAAEGMRAVGLGARTLKVKVAAGSLALDVARLGALRAAVGPEVRLRLDANGGWMRMEASRALAALTRACAPELCEQPVAATDVDGLRGLRAEGHCRIGADEALASVERAEQIIASEAADAIILKPMVLGGLLPALRLGLMARARGMAAIVTSSLDGVIARAGAAHLAAVLGEDAWAHGLWVGPLFVDEPAHPYVPEQGAILLPSGPGLGLVQAARGNAGGVR